MRFGLLSRVILLLSVLVAAGQITAKTPGKTAATSGFTNPSALNPKSTLPVYPYLYLGEPELWRDLWSCCSSYDGSLCGFLVLFWSRLPKLLPQLLGLLPLHQLPELLHCWLLGGILQSWFPRARLRSTILVMPIPSVYPVDGLPSSLDFQPVGAIMPPQWSRPTVCALWKPHLKRGGSVMSPLLWGDSPWTLHGSAHSPSL
ncbi:hypothetical protein AOLI_G00040570 [Acnodon oligacanthus]